MKQTTELIIKIICIIILLTLNIAIYLNGRNLTCDNCVISFKTYSHIQSKISGEPINNFSIQLNDLYNNYLNDTCLITFENEQFYYKG